MLLHYLDAFEILFPRSALIPTELSEHATENKGQPESNMQPPMNAHILECGVLLSNISIIRLRMQMKLRIFRYQNYRILIK